MPAIASAVFAGAKRYRHADAAIVIKSGSAAGAEVSDPLRGRFDDIGTAQDFVGAGEDRLPLVEAPHLAGEIGQHPAGGARRARERRRRLADGGGQPGRFVGRVVVERGRALLAAADAEDAAQGRERVFLGVGVAHQDDECSGLADNARIEVVRGKQAAARFQRRNGGGVVIAVDAAEDDDAALPRRQRLERLREPRRQGGLAARRDLDRRVGHRALERRRDEPGRERRVGAGLVERDADRGGEIADRRDRFLEGRASEHGEALGADQRWIDRRHPGHRDRLARRAGERRLAHRGEAGAEQERGLPRVEPDGRARADRDDAVAHDGASSVTTIFASFMRRGGLNAARQTSSIAARASPAARVSITTVSR